ncbi:hypothetical protein Hanom_Chr11g01042371 [Helianthus anomalus]
MNFFINQNSFNIKRQIHQYEYNPNHNITIEITLFALIYSSTTTFPVACPSMLLAQAASA